MNQFTVCKSQTLYCRKTAANVSTASHSSLFKTNCSHMHRHALLLSRTHIHIQDAPPLDKPKIQFKCKLRWTVQRQDALWASLHSSEEAGRVGGRDQGSHCQLQGPVLIPLHRMFPQGEQNLKRKLFYQSLNIHSSWKESVSFFF